VFKEELGEVLDFLCARADPTPGDLDLLDLGCGPGNFLSLAKARGFRVSGVEATEELAERARRTIGGQVIVGDVSEANVPRKAFDVITMLDLIEHLRDPVQVLRKYRESLKEGGTLVVFTPNHSSMIVKISRMINAVTLGLVSDPCDKIFDCLHVTFFDLDSPRNALEKSGFEVRATKMVCYRPDRRNLATGVVAAALRIIESVSRFLPSGPFRILMTAQPRP